jgi:hypothetical protein
MSLPTAWSLVLGFFGTPRVLEPSPDQLSGVAGLLPVRQFDQRIGLTRAFADALDDSRDPDLTEHTFLEMVRSRVYGILAGYEDQNDHDTLRVDPVFKLVADCSPEDHDLASQPTLSRFVVTHRPGATLLPEPTFGEYAGQGECENRNIRVQV